MNPWAVRSTDTDKEHILAGEAWEDVSGDEVEDYVGAQAACREPSGTDDNVFSTMDFLTKGSVALLNLIPDGKKQVKISRDDIEGKPLLHIIALDRYQTVLRKHCVTDPESEYPDTRDVTLSPGLDPDRHFTEKNRISIVREKGMFQLKDITTSKRSMTSLTQMRK